MIGLVQIYLLYIFSTIVLIGWKMSIRPYLTENLVEAAFIVVFIYFLVVNLSLVKLLKNEDEETKMKKIIADKREDFLQENI